MTTKQTLQSAGDGTAVPAGYVGETASVVLTAGGTTSTAGTYIDGTGTLTLQTGIWMINVLNTVMVSIGAANNTVPVAAVTALRTSANAVVARHFSQAYNAAAGAVANIGTTHSFSTVVNIPSGTSITYKLSILCGQSSGTAGGTASFYADGTNSGTGATTVSRIDAIRIA